MPIRIKFNIEYSLSENSTGGKELGLAPPWTGTNDQMDDGGTFRRKITAGATDVAVDINGLANCRFLTIKTNKAIKLKLNNTGNTAIDITPLGVGALDGIMVLTTDSVTVLYVSNLGTADAEVTFSIAGMFS